MSAMHCLLSAIHCVSCVVCRRGVAGPAAGPGARRVGVGTGRAPSLCADADAVAVHTCTGASAGTGTDASAGLVREGGQGSGSRAPLLRPNCVHAPARCQRRCGHCHGHCGGSEHCPRDQRAPLQSSHRQTPVPQRTVRSSGAAAPLPGCAHCGHPGTQRSAAAGTLFTPNADNPSHLNLFMLLYQPQRPTNCHSRARRRATTQPVAWLD